MPSKIAISGYAGTGKSTIIELASSFSNTFISKESAREIFEAKDFFDVGNISQKAHIKIFQKSIFDAEISKINWIHDNSNINNYLSDRSMIDNLAYAQILFGKKFIDFPKIEKYLTEFCESRGIDHIMNSTIYISPCKDLDFIEKNILMDDMRKKTSPPKPKEFLKGSEDWEAAFFSIHEKLPMITKNVFVLEHFTTNNNFMPDALRYISKEFID